ncbi:MAG: magnesium transporter [Rhodospirillales bacterium]|nr:MAG: magnesium transporter [Rhodospirillales bacterium]
MPDDASRDALSTAVRTSLERSDLDPVHALVGEEHPADLALLLEELEPDQAWQVLLLLPVDIQAEVFGYLDAEAQTELARHAKRPRLAAIVTAMNADERADLYNKLTEAQREALMPGLAQAEREDIRRLASYPKDTAGSIMTSDYATLPAEISVGEALHRLRREAPDKETIYRAYVVDDERRLIGSVRLQELILAEPATPIDRVMERNVLAVKVDEDQEVVARKVARYDMLALPVVDADDRIIGIVTHDDAMDVLQEEATEDFHKVGTIGKLEQNVRDAGISLLYRKRVAWLVLLVFGNLFSGAGIAFYEDTIAAFVGLVFFLPLLIASGGNAGAQAATLMVRALATGEVVLRDWGRMLGRELLVAGALGATMAVAVSAIGVVRGGPEIAVVVALTMVLVVIVGSLVGMSLPFLLRRLNMDPATASAPLVTSIADVAGVVIYFAIATRILLPGG